MNSIHILEKEKSLFTEILALSERQLLLFRSEGKNEDEIIETFRALIDQRQILMDTIDAFSNQTEGFNEISRNNAASDLIQEIQTIIANIRENDKEVITAGNRVLKGFSEQMKQARATMQAYSAYNYEDGTARMGWFVDRKK